MEFNEKAWLEKLDKLTTTEAFSELVKEITLDKDTASTDKDAPTSSSTGWATT